MATRRGPKVFPPRRKRPQVFRSLKRGSLLEFASREPIVAYSTTTVKQACKIMVDNGIRRTPVVDAGTRKLSGILSARDLVNLFGGGEKYQIIEKEFGGNIFAAVNLPIAKIMSEKVVYAKETERVEKVAERMLRQGVGGCPIVDKKGEVVAFVSEIDFIKRAARWKTGILVEDIMTTDVISATPGMSLGDAARIMINKGVRRLPVIHDNELVGMLRTSNILRFISYNDFARLGSSKAAEILEKERIGSIMSDYVITVRPDDRIEAIIEIMIARRLGGFPVERGGRMVGIVTEYDVFRALYS